MKKKSIHYATLAGQLTIASTILILAATLTPYDKLAECTKPDGNFLILKWVENSNIFFANRSTALDNIANLILFFPFGFSLSWYLRKQTAKTSFQIIVSIFCISLGLTYSVELAQVFLPSRCAQLNDVYYNTIGGTLGSFLYFYRKTFILGWVLAGFILSIPLQQETSLINWADDYFLTVANETTGDKPWQGEVSEFFITNTAMTYKEIKKLYNNNALEYASDDTLLSFYSFKKTGQYYNKVRTNTSLQQQWHPTTSGINTDPTKNHLWFKTSAPPRQMIKNIRETGHFTIAAAVTPRNNVQKGPARIISLSHNSNRRNFTLGQSSNDLVFRLRTPVTGRNGFSPQFTVPGVFATTSTKRITITYDGATLLIYIDRPDKPHKFQLTPGAVVFNSFKEIKSASFLALYNIMYYVLIFSPLGIMYLLIEKKCPNEKFYHRLAILSSCVIFAAIALESLLIYASGKSFMLGNIALSVIAAACPLLITALNNNVFKLTLAEH